MKREIKFRAWSKKFGMLYSNDKQTVWAGGLEPSVNTNTGKLTDDFELMQYTGLKDKNGKEIYEGDIIQYKYYFASRRWWSSVDEIPEIEEDMQKQRDDIKIIHKPVEFTDGGFTLGYELEFHRLFRFDGLYKKGQHNSGEWESKEWDFEVIGNIYSNPELLNQ